MLKFSVLTLFPDMFDIFQKEGVIARSLKEGQISLETVFLRDFADNPQKRVDDRPIGGGDGMVLRADIAQKALESVLTPESFVVHLSPKGKVFDNKMAKSLSQKSHLVFLCGRYAGFDDRFVESYAHVNISLGDYVLSGGELPAMCIMDSVARYVPSVLGNPQSSCCDSFEDNLLEAPQYTKPLEFKQKMVPEILLSGHHEKIASFRRKEQLRITALNRPDLILSLFDSLTQKEKLWVQKIWKHQERGL